MEIFWFPVDVSQSLDMFFTFFRSFSDLPCSTLFEWWARRVHLWERCCTCCPSPVPTWTPEFATKSFVLCWVVGVGLFENFRGNTEIPCNPPVVFQVNLPHFRGKVMHHFKTQHVCNATTMFCRGAGTVLTADQAAMVGDTVKRVEVMW
jgi:hypothetical protein